MDLELLKNGEVLPLVESFYTLQGEGYNTGKAVFFIRIGGCDVGCSWCDSKESWNRSAHPLVHIGKIVSEACAHRTKSIVITGGEPLIYSLDKLCELLRKHNLEIFIETSGSSPLSGSFNWICLSPKRKKRPLSEIYGQASELKIIIETEADFLWAEENRALVGNDCKLYLQPEWNRRNIVLPEIIKYIKNDPCWALSLQTHKFINIP